MLRAAMPGDEPAIEAFLARHAETSMFLRGNLADHGLSGGDDPRATSYWLHEQAGQIAAVFGISKAGFAMGQAPGAGPELWREFRQMLTGRKLAGLTGEAAQIDTARQGLGLETAEFTQDEAEPLYRLSLEDLIIPDTPGHLRAPGEADRALLTKWHAAYVEELRMSTPAQRDAEAAQRTERSITSGATRLLVGDNGTPLAMTAFNARLPDMVQIGAVYTPPEQRGLGLARRVVAMHLAEARADGVETAILFASGPAACRAYEAIGFQLIGSYHLSILENPLVLS